MQGISLSVRNLDTINVWGYLRWHEGNAHEVEMVDYH
jgi:hypothetical protein